MNIAIMGYGNVGRALVELLRERGQDLASAYGLAPTVTGVVARRGAALSAAGIDLSRPIELVPEPDAVDRAIADSHVVVEVTPTDVRSGGAGLDHCRRALRMGRHVVTANKGPLVVAYRELAGLARERGLQFRFEGTVMSGTPSVALGTEILAPAGVRSARGILNGTTNYILTQMEGGDSYANALRRAQELGYAETDPTADVEGWDAAAKAVILANALMGGDLGIDDVDREGITGITMEQVAEARAAGMRWKLVANVRGRGAQVTASVGPVRLPMTDVLAHAISNAIIYDTEMLGEVTLMGAGAGGRATAFALLSDLLRVHALAVR